MLNLWLDPDDVIQGEDGDGGGNDGPRPKRTVSDHFRPPKDDGQTEQVIPPAYNLISHPPERLHESIHRY